MAKLKKSHSPKDTIAFPQTVTRWWLLITFVIFPIFVNNKYADILQAKYYFFIITTYLAILLTGIYVLIKKGWPRYKLDIRDIAMLAFGGIGIISTLTASPYIKEAITGETGRYNGLILMLAYVGMFFMVSRFLKFEKDIYIWFLLSGIYVALIGIGDYFYIDTLGYKANMSGNQDIFTSTIGNIDSYVAFLAFPMVISGTLFTLDRCKTFTRVFYYVTFVIILYGMMTGMADNGYLSLGLFFALLPIAALRTKNGLKRFAVLVATFLSLGEIAVYIGGIESIKTIRITSMLNTIMTLPYLEMAAAVLWIIAIILYILFRKSSDDDKLPGWVRLIWGIFIGVCVLGVIAVFAAVNSSQELAEKTGSLRRFLVFDDNWGVNRGYTWKAIVHDVRYLDPLKQIFGSGPDTLGLYMYEFRYNDMMEKTGQFFDSAHNSFLHYYFTLGPIGVLSYTVMIVSTGIIAFKNFTKENGVCIVAAGLAVLCFAFQSTVNIIVPIVDPIMWVLMAIVASMTRKESK